MWDLELKDGDIFFDNFGNLETIYDHEEIIQSVQMRLNTLKGSLFYNENYGLPGDYERLKTKFNTLTILQAYVEECILQDKRIKSVVSIDFIKIDYTGTLLEIKMTLTDDTLLEISHIL